MRLLLKFGLKSLAWSLRRLHVPVASNELVLEIGSGGNPYFRSNVLVDAYETTRQRHYVPLVHDRPTVLAYGENLPFADKSFDFVIASHVLEHSTNPEKFISELSRVAKGGYIEVPDAFMERINPYRDHRLEITDRAGKLLIRKKSTWKEDPELVELYEARAKSVLTESTFRKNPFDFHVRYYWKGQIDYQVLNTEVDAAWPEPESGVGPGIKFGIVGKIKQALLGFCRKAFSQRERNRNLSLESILICPRCSSKNLLSKSGAFVCNSCNQSYEVHGKMPVMMVSSD